MKAKFIPKTGELRRAGLSCNIDSTLSNVGYYARGPWENYVDRKDACFVGRYATTVDKMVEPNMKPQTTGGREDMRELVLSDGKGFGVKIEAQGQVGFSALRYTDADLMNALHYWDIKARPYIVLHLDAWTRGLGNASCGQDVDTLPKYKVPASEMNYTVRISCAE